MNTAECTRCGGRDHNLSGCKWPNVVSEVCQTCWKKTTRECGHVVCGNRITLTANSPQPHDGRVMPRFSPGD